MAEYSRLLPDTEVDDKGMVLVGTGDDEGKVLVGSRT
jgi:hypothetical protein